MQVTHSRKTAEAKPDPQREAQFKMLRTMGEMSTYLRRQGYIARSKEVLRRYATDGVRAANGELVVLRSVKMNRIHYSSEAWFKDFIDQLERT